MANFEGESVRAHRMVSGELRIREGGYVNEWAGDRLYVSLTDLPRFFAWCRETFPEHFAQTVSKSPSVGTPEAASDSTS